MLAEMAKSRHCTLRNVGWDKPTRVCKPPGLHQDAFTAWQIVVNCLLDHAGEFFGALALCLGLEGVPPRPGGMFGQREEARQTS
jgi:hypothetical protein